MEKSTIYSLAQLSNTEPPHVDRVKFDVVSLLSKCRYSTNARFIQVAPMAIIEKPEYFEV